MKEFKYFPAQNSSQKLGQKIAKGLYVVITTINTIAFAIIGVPIYLLLKVVGLGIEAFKFTFLRNKTIKEEVKISKYARNRARKVCKTKVPMYSLEEIINLHSEKEVSKAAIFFKEEKGNKILFTNNLLRKVPEKKNEINIKALGKEQKSIHEFLVVEDIINGEKKYTIVAGDLSTDAKFFRKKLAQDKLQTNPTQASSRTRKVCLYDLSMGVVQNGANPIDEIALSSDPNFLKLIVQLKLYNGEVKYNEKEEEILLKMIESKENRELMQTFLKRAFVWKDQKAKAYSASRLKKVLTKKKFAA